MIDTEKVIKGIRECLSRKPCSEINCPYVNECAVEHLNHPLLRDALELLKLQRKQKQMRLIDADDLKHRIDILISDAKEDSAAAGLEGNHAGERYYNIRATTLKGVLTMIDDSRTVEGSDTQL